MKALLIYLILITYPPCGDPVTEVISGPFADSEVCEEMKVEYLRRKGPPKPGKVMACARRAEDD